jgi:uncharacterized protein YlaI
MKAICILCDRSFTPDRKQSKKIHKYPQRIQICTACKQRIRQKTLARRQKNG